MIKELCARNCSILWLWSICVIEDCVSCYAWHSVKSLTWLWHSITGLCLDVSVSRHELVLAKALAVGSVPPLWHCCKCPRVWALNILSRFDLQDCVCIMQTWLEFPTPLFLSLPLALSMTASVNRPQQTISDAFFPLLLVISLLTSLMLCSPFCLLSPLLQAHCPSLI